MSFFEWLSENWEIVCIFFGIFVNALGLFYNVIKYWRGGGFRRAEEHLELLCAARRFVCEAERLEDASGAEKLQYVLLHLREFADEMRYAFDEAEMMRCIEEDIAFSKQVNATKSEVLE